MSRRRRPQGGSNVVALYLKECERYERPDRDAWTSAAMELRYFGPLNPALRTPDALRELQVEFGSVLNSASWLTRELAKLEDVA